MAERGYDSIVFFNEILHLKKLLSFVKDLIFVYPLLSFEEVVSYYYFNIVKIF